MITRETKLEDIAKFFHKVMCSCGAVIGRLHNIDCDIARCTMCGEQAWCCRHDWNPDTWTGFWPGTIDAVENGWYVRWDGPEWPHLGVSGHGWVECDGNHPDAQPDLNRVAIETAYDPVLRRRVRRDMDPTMMRYLYKDAGFDEE